jgi:hypothetical protein
MIASLAQHEYRSDVHRSDAVERELAQAKALLEHQRHYVERLKHKVDALALMLMDEYPEEDFRYNFAKECREGLN